MTTQTQFSYSKAQKIAHWGCHFDSLTELKYAISILDDYEFMRERIAIFYDPSNRQPMNYLKGNYRHYTPDFLIRHKTTGKAYLIEVKPRDFEGHSQLELRKEVAENYIRWKNYDWEYKVVFDDEIILDAEQLLDFKECCRLKSKSSFKLWFEQYKRKLEWTENSFLKNASPEARIRFIMFGNMDQAE